MRTTRNSKQLKAVAPSEGEGAALAEALEPPPSEKQGLPARPGRGKAGPFLRVPTHAIAGVDERRTYPRAALSLPLRLKRVGGQREPQPVSLLTKNISSSGVYFLCPRWIEPGTAIELEVGLVDRPLGRGSVRMTTAAHIVRVDPTDTPGWHGLAASFDDISFVRDEPIPPPYEKP
ncbi:MAG TPA: PilZ domain-containing protein [Candidatus Acidoferrales bacterium]|jgi:hypothetical protein|nr:PilZ domain-containing protein [Candidatus Acidoferrales bacterium]